tara:strand:- start:960 stop:1358 length:399 start_codon:yes stop_codon:yes gene_type:complete
MGVPHAKCAKWVIGVIKMLEYTSQCQLLAFESSEDNDKNIPPCVVRRKESDLFEEQHVRHRQNLVSEEYRQCFSHHSPSVMKKGRREEKTEAHGKGRATGVRQLISCFDGGFEEYFSSVRRSGRKGLQISET